MSNPIDLSFKARVLLMEVSKMLAQLGNYYSLLRSAFTTQAHPMIQVRSVKVSYWSPTHLLKYLVRIYIIAGGKRDVQSSIRRRPVPQMMAATYPGDGPADLAGCDARPLATRGWQIAEEAVG